MRIKMSNEKWRRLISNGLLFAYHIAIVNTAINQNPIVWHVVTGICAIFGLRYLLTMKIGYLMFLLTSIVSTAINVVFIHGANFSKLLLLVLSFFCVLYFLHSNLNPKVMLLASLVIIVWFLYRYIYNNKSIDAVLNGSSYNYISIYVLIPIVLYYIISEYKNEEIRLWPSIVGMIACTISIGRSGIIAGAFLALGVYLVKYFSKEQKGGLSKFVIALFIFLIFLLFLMRMSDVIQTVYLSKLIQYGLSGRGRFEIWHEYILTAMRNPISFLFGVDTTKLYYAMLHGGNPHNLFLATHQLSGFFPLFFLIFFIIRRFWKAIKKKKRITCIALTVFLLRGFTDNFIWCSFAMVPFMLVIFLDKENNNSNNWRV